MFDLALGPEEIRSVEDVLRSNWITMGEVTRDFESAFADYLGIKHAIAVNSGTAALHLAHYVLGAKPDDEIICPSLTFVATSNAILYTGAKPVFADIANLDDLTISPDDIEAKVNEKTKGIVVMHYGGFPCNMNRIMEIARRHNLYVVEDAAHAPGAEYRKQKLGTIGDVGCFSFFGNKNMTTAEGGMVVTNRDDLAEKIRTARSHGMTSLTWDRYSGHAFSYDVVDLGFNYRIDELRSSLGLVQLSKLAGNNEKRRALWFLYRDRLVDVEEIGVPFSESIESSSCHIFPVLLSRNVGRADFTEYLCHKGIQTSVHYPPVHKFSFYKRFMSNILHLPLTEEIGKREISLPLFPSMSEDHVVYVVKCVKAFLAG